MPRLVAALLVVVVSFPALAVELAPSPRSKVGSMPFTGLTPSKVVPDLCLVRYPAGTTSVECQTFCDQGLGYFYSYVWIEAARCFETALTYDPDCAFAWLGFHRALEKWGKGAVGANGQLAIAGAMASPKLPERLTKTPKDYALDRAKLLMPKAPHRVQLLIQAKLQEKGLWPNVTPEERKKKAQASLDELLTIYDDDQEGWYARAQIAEGVNAQVPIYKALLKVNPVHPGANHELVHFYEGFKRPALGWQYAEGYMKSSPGIPHAFHMQSHLAMRIGKWQFTSDNSSRALAMQIEYHKFIGVKPSEDHQFFHHMETLTRSLVHDGRFKEADEIKAKAAGYSYNFRPEWFRMALGRHDWAEANKTVEFYRKSDKATAAYHAAMIALEQGNATAAAAEVDVLRQAAQTKKTDKKLETRLWEVQGRLQCQTGQGEAGSKLLQRAVAKTKDDYAAHAWAGGAYYMEVWGTAALEAGIAADAEEAFQEALAHDSGSVRGALGMWALCSRLGRTEEAERFLKVARRCWAKAEPKDFERMQDDFAKRAQQVPTPAAVTGEGS